MAPTTTPQSHSKNAATGKGTTPRIPGNAGSVGPSNHVPKLGK
jgi:hypothetical protein